MTPGGDVVSTFPPSSPEGQDGVSRQHLPPPRPFFGGCSASSHSGGDLLPPPPRPFFAGRRASSHSDGDLAALIEEGEGGDLSRSSRSSSRASSPASK